MRQHSGHRLVLAAAVLGLVAIPKWPALADEIRNVSTARTYETLDAALKAAKVDETIEISGGPFKGNFIISVPLTLRGIEMDGHKPVLDGNGSGTVVDVRADNVMLGNLEIRNSGRTADPFAIWGDSGVGVHGDRATLTHLKVTGNDWGVLLYVGAQSAIKDSDISDNIRDGVRIMGGTGHVLEHNVIDRNGSGVSIDAFYPDPVLPLTAFGNPMTVKDFAEKHAKMPLASQNRVTGNEVRGNGFYGIGLTWHSHDNIVEDNDVFLTGRERDVDETMINAWEAQLARISGIPAKVDRDPYGTGIVLLCLANHNRIVENRVHDNLSHGIELNLANANEVRANRVSANRVGIYLISANDNSITANHVSDSVEYGIRIGSDSIIRPSSNKNLVALNDLGTNHVNAFDSSARQVSSKDIGAILDTLPLGPVVKQQIAKNKIVRDQMVKAYLANLHPGINAWDDGHFGNHHDDFDLPQEGFVDRDGDGISEIGRPIPGGSSVDHHPLTAERLRQITDLH